MSERSTTGVLQSPLLSYAFRPFFLAMAIFAVLSMLVWVFAMHGRGPDFLPINTVYWHSHEMLIGFAMAAVAGFTLTAVSTWTGRRPISGAWLLALVLAWLAGRVAMVFGGVLPAVWVAAIDMLFPLLLAVAMAIEVVLAGNRRHFPIVLLLLMMLLFNGVYHLAAAGYIDMQWDGERIGMYLLLHLLLIFITVIGGRIVPYFTANWLRAKGEARLPRQGGVIDRLVIPFTLLTGLFASLLPLNRMTGLMALGAALSHAWRLSRWRGLSTVREPLLFVLHVAYLWLPVGYLLAAGSVLGWGIQPMAALHALTVGAIAFMILAVSTRVGLAHTGRPLHALRALVIAYCLMLFAVIVRVLSPYGSAYFEMVNWAAAGWMASFAVFLWVYWPILLSPRVDAMVRSG